MQTDPPPAPVPYLHREVQAREELGHTAVSPTVAGLLAGLFLGLVVGVPALQLTGGWAGGNPFRQLAESLPGAMEASRQEGLWSANRTLLASMNRFEDRLEEESWVVERLLPPVQGVLTGVLGVGNQQVYTGRDGWLFYRPAVDSLTGPGFLGSGVLAARRAGGDAWEAPVEPDPLPALLGLARDLERRGIRLLVLPVPVKAAIHPERLTRRPARPPLRNPSFGELVRSLEAAGIEVLDLGPLLTEAARREGRPQYLATDTHWAPGGMDAAARAVAGWVERRLPPGRTRAYRSEERTVRGIGDIARMLRLPAGQRLYPPQDVTVTRVSEPDGSPWRSDLEAEILLLGDSFTNVFSQPDLGWGSGAGFAEQLSLRLQRPIDRIAVNAGGAHASRQSLTRALAAGEDRLAGKRLVIYEFSARELAVGDWRRLGLAPGGD
ncbi:MAG TPA: hypothetical protein VEL74_09855 [Thermoanaerobaculia bacterium]|nr:hypothetical protein [Thermoanaerobaculia bacterium]